MTRLSLAQARRIALTAQGFNRPRPEKVTAHHVAKTIRQLGLLQIDYVNALVPSHYLVLFSRLGPYRRALLDDLIFRKRNFFEHWAHEASILPVESWPLLRHRMAEHRVRPWGFETFLAANPGYAARVLEEIQRRGPLGADQTPEPEGETRIAGAWHQSVRRAVLEAHFGRGILAIADRRANFSRVYDLTGRVIPSAHLGREIERQEAQRGLLLDAARAHGVGTAADLADYYRMPIGAAKPLLNDLLQSGEIQEAEVEGWREMAYLSTKTNPSCEVRAAALLSPFDPVVWFRRRAARLFGFDYRLEIFVPKAQRKWGYYVLPFLLGERLAARVDVKADRAARRLVVLAAYCELGINPEDVAAPLGAELRSLSVWLQLDSVAVLCKRKFGRTLAVALRD